MIALIHSRSRESAKGIEGNAGSKRMYMKELKVGERKMVNIITEADSRIQRSDFGGYFPLVYWVSEGQFDDVISQ
jgi:hypothetical protein